MPHYAVLENNVITDTLVADDLATAQAVTEKVCVDIDNVTAVIGSGYDPVTATFTTQASPHPSWVQDGASWKAPVDMPADGRNYVWVEETTSWVEKLKYPSWHFDEASKKYLAPVPYPTDGKLYGWDESKQEWEITEPLDETVPN